ncbi:MULTISPECIES: lytic transglycosylase domain-containing protein [Sphingomonas]|uniref:lytic transglycosylase domain-containing protein n=1 Tax=Sphingomonas TaxID=13687 RepID=UPI001F07DA3F|nr:MULTISPECIES: lytic transglycosylase domain-containing protein [Sphingomonas]
MGIALGATAGAQVAHADVIELAADGSATLKAADRNSTTRLPSAAPSDLTDGPDVPVEALTLTNGPVGPPEYSAMLHQAAEAHGLSPALLEALVWQESRWHPAVRSRAGAIGLAQLMPGTARDLGVDPTDPTTNLYGGARYLRQQLDRFDGDVERALAAYNAGPGRVLRAAGVPRIAETQSYVRSIVDRLSRSTEAQGASR